MNNIILMPMLSAILQRICLMELKRVMRLWLYIHANYLESGTVITHARSTCAAE
jgi:hypothetical protein